MSDEQIIELGLSRPAGSDRGQIGVFAALIDRMLTVIGETAIESHDPDTATFRAALKTYRAQLTAEMDGAALEAVSRACLETCQQFLVRASEHVGERDREFAAVIELLREALATFAGQSKDFHESLMGSSQRFSRLAQVDDIRELRRQLAREVSELQRVVAERQKQDEAYHGRLAKRVAALETKIQKTMEEASLDPLTRIANRRGFEVAIRRWISRYSSTGSPFVTAMLDIDDFKRINDVHGHQIGDRVLICAAQVLSKEIRATDVLARFGGEEFVVLLDNIGIQAAEERLVHVLEEIAATRYEYTEVGRVFGVTFTVSCGATEFAPGDRPDDLVKRADDALYEAKRRGKNRVITRKKSILREFLDQRRRPAPKAADVA